MRMHNPKPDGIIKPPPPPAPPARQGPMIRTMVYLGREELNALRQDASALQERSDCRVGVTTVVREVVRQHYGLDGEQK